MLVARTPVLPVAIAPPDWSVTVDPAQALVTVELASVIAPGVVGNTSRIVMPETVPEFAAGFVTVNVSVVVAPATMLAAPKALEIVGAAKTTRPALPPVVVGPLLAVTLPMLFRWPPAGLGVLLVTVTVTVHDPPGAICAPDNATLPPPPVAEATPLVHVVAAPGAAAFTIAAGYVSENAMPVTVVVVFGLASVIVSVEVPPAWIDEGVKDLVALMPLTTVRTPLTEVPLPAFVVAMAPVLLVYTPGEFAVTFTVTVQVAPAAIVAPESATLVPLFAALTTPAPQFTAAPLALAVFTIGVAP